MVESPKEVFLTKYTLEMCGGPSFYPWTGEGGLWGVEEGAVLLSGAGMGICHLHGEVGLLGSVSLAVQRGPWGKYLCAMTEGHDGGQSITSPGTSCLLSRGEVIGL